MNAKTLGRLLVLSLGAAAAALLISRPSTSQTTPVSLAAPISATSEVDYNSVPVTSVETAPPLVMLTISRDHQLHYKAYNDYSDLDGDGALETTYKHAIDYYGYFDSYKCYTYDTTNGRFVPSAISTDKYCSGAWSGNFLNWVTMTRMDAVRKLLYGGQRSTDTNALTVLQRGPLPTDAHAFAKYYNGSDIAQLTPFTNTLSTPTTYNSVTTTATNVKAYERSNPVSNTSNDAVTQASSTAARSFRLTLSQVPGLAIGDQVRIDPRPAVTGRYMIGTVLNIASSIVYVEVPSSGVFNGSSNNYTDWTVTNLSSTGLSFCNLTWSGTSGTDQFSNTTTQPPLMRVAKGNFELWGANEKWQCYWREEQSHLQTSFAGGLRSNGNRASASALRANAENPRKAATTGNAAEPQHALGSGSNAGAAGTANGEFYVRVEACKATLEGKERCKQYPSVGSAKKPIGLLQVYGDEDRMRFGLITSSYRYNVSGGVLRKNIGSFQNEINETTDGTFVANPTGGGIIDTLQKLKMLGYNYRSGTYISNTYDNCDYQLVGIAAHGTTAASREVAEGNCASWGNPLGEAYLESLRYLAGLPRTDDFNYTAATSDTTNKDSSLGLSVQTFSDPLSASNYCASLNVLAFTASVSSYDNDQMGGLSAMRGSPSAAAYTNIIGGSNGENIHGGSYFIGRNGTNNNQSCTAKTIPTLAAVDGICPEAPAIEGSFLISGAAYYAHTNRIRNDFSSTQPPANDTRSLKVDTYGIELATNTPVIRIKQPGTNGKTVVIQPVYRLDRSSNGSGPFGSGAIVDFRVVYQDEAAGRGRFYVNWEDSTQGGDYDQDMWGLIDYEFVGNQVKITTDAVSASTNNGQGFGYIISGTTKDGPHFHSGIYGYDYLDEASSNPITVRDPAGTVLNNINVATYGRIFINANGGCSDCQIADPPTTVTYDLGTSTAGVLKSPLYYAAKWGGFADSNNNGRPDLTSEWDSRDSDGSIGTDGLPDTYFFVSNPNALESSLRAAFDAILAKTASGTAAAVVSNAREGEGAVYQALFEPSRTDASGRKATWIGTVQSLWIDKLGRLREDDGDQIFQESDYTRDPVVEAFYDPSDRTTKLRRYSGNPAVSTASTVVPLSSLKSLWNARKQLSSVSNVTSQRSFSSPANTGRHLLTFVDNNQNRTIDSGEIVDFMPASFTSNKYGLLNAQTSADATNIVNYIRGQEISGLRSRSVDYDGDGTPDVQRLGDVVSSTPTAVGAPSEGYSTLYGDETYSAFVKQYRDRRTVVYVGGNDGVIHAFNGGFYDPTAKRFRTQRTSADAAHPLGSEIWGYVPYNLLPHLRWLTNNNYGHVYYIDGKPRVFDARIFTPDATHPYGWGTVMVIGMRFGGGSLQMNTKTGTTVNPPFSGLSNVPNPMVMRSAYILMDITNPEVAPTVIAEINDAGSTTPKLGLTTGLPTAFTFSQRANSTSGTYTSENWYLTFGTGPDSLSQVNSATNEAGLYVYDLRARSFVSGYAPLSLGTNATTGAPTSFLGDPVSVDWDLDFKADALYFGTVGGTAASPSGKLFKLALNESAAPSGWSAPQVLTDPGAPVTSTPSVALDENNNRWVYAGTGRYYINNDKASTPQQYLFGVIDRVNASASPAETLPVSFANLIDTTAAKVRTTGAVEGVTATPAVTSEAGLASATASKRGWKLRLNYPGSTPAEREVTRTSLLGEVLFATTFTPSNTLCTGEGSSRLFALYFKTGAGRSNLPALGTIGDNGIDNDGDGDGDSGTGGDDADDNVVITNLSLGGGQASNPALHLGGSVAAPAGGGGDTDPNSGGSLGAAGCGAARTEITALSQTSVAALENRKIAIVPGACSGEIDWRDSRRSIGN